MWKINLLDPAKNSKILDHEYLTKKTIGTLLNEIYTTDKDENECRVENFAEQSDLQIILFFISFILENSCTTDTLGEIYKNYT